MKTHHKPLISKTQIILVLTSFFLGWKLSPLTHKLNPITELEQTGFNYKMGRLKEFNPIPNTTRRSLPINSTGSNKVVGSAALPEIKFVDPKPHHPTSTNKGGKKKESNAQTAHVTKSKTTKQIARNQNHTQAVGITSQATAPGATHNNTYVHSEDILEKSNPTIIPGMAISGTAISGNTVNNSEPTSHHNATQNSEITEDTWVIQMMQSPTLEMAKKFFAAYKHGDVSQNVYFATAKNLIFDPIDSRKQIGLYLISLEVSTKSFLTLFEIMERDPSFNNSTDFILSGYLTESGIIALLPILYSNTNDKLILFALKTVEKALSSGVLLSAMNPSQSVPVSSPKRGGDWRRLATGATFDLKNRLLSAINKIVHSKDFQPETIQLAQSIESIINQSRIVATDS